LIPELDEEEDEEAVLKADLVETRTGTGFEVVEKRSRSLV
jgi:hypothetical protein